MTRPVKPTHRHRQAGRPLMRVSVELLASLTYRLTGRDRQVIEAVWDHRVLTTEQIAAIHYGSVVRARHRLLQLHRLSVLIRFRPWTPVGTAPWHWVLGPAGAHVLAAQRGITPRDLGYRPERALAIASSRKLGHQVGVNGFFADLHAHARRRNATEGNRTRVDQWWPEHRCATAWKGLARPDAFGRWIETQHHGQHSGQQAGRTAGLDFFLEYDNGTNPLPRLVGKLEGYAVLAEALGTPAPVLFWLPSARRETHLRRLLTHAPVPVATAVHTPALVTDARERSGRPTDTQGPAGPIWLPVGQLGPRRRLATLADAWGGYETDRRVLNPPDERDA